MRTVAFYTLGCKVNQYETQALKEQFMNRGFSLIPFQEIASVYVINTCHVTHVAEKKSKQLIRQAKKKNPKGIVIVCGCMAQGSESIIEMADIVVGNHNKGQILDLLERYDGNTQVVRKAPDQEYEKLCITKYEEKTRAFVKIQDGCRQFCSYCIIPLVRGKLKSRDEQDIVDEIKTLVDHEYKEIVLTGIHVASYGVDRNQKDALLHLLQKINDLPNLKRIRISSIDPTLFTRDFIDQLTRIEKLCPHFHLSLQSGLDKTLKRMNRHYTTAQFKESVDYIRSKIEQCAISTDLIVGFPGETEHDFLETCRFVERISFSKAHVFPFSRREKTKAYNMPGQVEMAEKKRRAAFLSSLVKQSEKNYMQSFVGKDVFVLLERKDNNLFYGMTEFGIKACSNQQNLKLGAIQKLHIRQNVQGILQDF